MKKVLIISYYWPPSGGAGVQRWLKFAKYLPEYGVEPIILTVNPDDASYAQTDASLNSEIPERVKVFYTRTFELYNLYKFISRKKEIPYGGFVNERKVGFFEKAIRFVRSHLFIPDPRIGWNRFAYKKAAELIKEYNISTVITTSPPHSTQLIGLKLKRKFNIKWFADLRDPWTDIFYYKELCHSTFSKLIDKRFERKVLVNADEVITVSQSLKKTFITKSVLVQPSKVRVIPNGFDNEDYKENFYPVGENFIISYTGTINDEYNINSFLDALDIIYRDGYRNIKVRFIGKLSPTIIEKIKQKPISSLFEFVGYVNHSESVLCLQLSNALLLAIPNVENNKGILTGKLFEYIGAQRPIVGVGPVDGDAARIIDECKCGYMFDYNDTKSILNYLMELLKEWTVNQRREMNISHIQKYSRKQLTSELANLI